MNTTTHIALTSGSGEAWSGVAGSEGELDVDAFGQRCDGSFELVVAGFIIVDPSLDYEVAFRKQPRSLFFVQLS